MGNAIVSGLDAIRAAAKERGGGKSNKDAFLKLEDGDVKRIHFLQELDEASENYNPEFGLGVLAVEWRDPQNFRKRALDTSMSDPEGRCWMAEQGGDWKPRTSLYINVLVEDEKGNTKVQVLNQGFGSKTVVDWLIEYAGDAGSITNVPFKIRRTGSGQFDTSYTLTPAGVPGEPKAGNEVEADQLHDIQNDILRQIPYEEQEEFFRGGDDKAQGNKSGGKSESIW